VLRVEEVAAGHKVFRRRHGALLPDVAVTTGERVSEGCCVQHGALVPSVASTAGERVVAEVSDDEHCTARAAFGHWWCVCTILM
jgi:hypothetical protein